MSHEEAVQFSRTICCTVELRDMAKRVVAVTKTVRLDGVQLQLTSDAAQGLYAGQVIELKSETAPLGPFSATAIIGSFVEDLNHRGRQVVRLDAEFLNLSAMQSAALRARLESYPPLVVTLGLEGSLSEICCKAFRCIEVADSEEVCQYYDQEDVAVLVLGSRLAPPDAYGILSRCRTEFPNSLGISVVLNTGPSVDLFQEFVDEDRVFYLARGIMSNEQLGSIVVAGVNRFQAKLEKTRKQDALASDTADRLLDYCVRLSQQFDVANADALLVEAAQNLINASRAQCLIYDAATDTLWSVDRLTHEERRESAAAGLVGYVARTGLQIQLERMAVDPRYDADADSRTSGDSRFIAQPVMGTDGALIAVVSAVRDGNAAPFSAEEAKILKLLTTYAAPTFSSILLRTQVHELVSDQAQGTLPTLALFRKEALEYRTQYANQDGHLLSDLPRWLKRSYLVVVLLVVAGLGFISVARLDENVSGPLLIRSRIKSSVTARARGLVGSVILSVGDQVKEGDLLVRFQSIPGDTLLDRLNKELRAPVSGTISDIRVRPGQELAPGDQVASIVDAGSGNEAIALLPGAYAPQIRSGMSIVLRLQGYPDSRETVPIESLSTEIVGPQEAARYAGKESAGALDVAGPIVIARSVLRKPTFEADGRTYNYHDGMVGQAEVSVRSDPIVLSLVPGLKEALKRPKGLLRIK